MDVCKFLQTAEIDCMILRVTLCFCTQPSPEPCEQDQGCRLLEGGPKRGWFLLTTLLPAACSARTWASVSSCVQWHRGKDCSSHRLAHWFLLTSWCSLRSWHPRIFLSEETWSCPGPHRVSHWKQREAGGGGHRRRRFGRRPGSGAGLSLPHCTRQGNTPCRPEGLLKASGAR